jgi:hypothetical protein
MDNLAREVVRLTQLLLQAEAQGNTLQVSVLRQKLVPLEVSLEQGRWLATLRASPQRHAEGFAASACI